MDISVDKFNKLEEINMYICNPDGKELFPVIGLDRNVTLRFNDLSELTFKVHSTYTDPDGETVAYEAYDWIQTKRLIKLDKIGKFRISGVTENETDTWEKYKEVTCESYQAIFKDRGVYLDDQVYGFYNPEDSTDAAYAGGEEGSLPSVIGQMRRQLDIAIDLSDSQEYYDEWTITYITPGLFTTAASPVYRHMEEGAATGYEWMCNTVSEAFGIVFNFDSLHNTIKVMTPEEVTTQTNIVFSMQNLLKSIDVEEDASEVVTVLNVEGKDCDVSLVNPQGTNYICDFSYYIASNIIRLTGNGTQTVFDIPENRSAVTAVIVDDVVLDDKESTVRNIITTGMSEMSNYGYVSRETIEALYRLENYIYSIGLGVATASNYVNVVPGKLARITWNSTNITRFSSALTSWNISSADILNKSTTVVGVYLTRNNRSFAINALVQTSDGPVLLSKGQVESYLDYLFSVGGTTVSNEWLPAADRQFMYTSSGISYGNLIGGFATSEAEASATAQMLDFAGYNMLADYDGLRYTFSSDVLGRFNAAADAVTFNEYVFDEATHTLTFSYAPTSGADIEVICNNGKWMSGELAAQLEIWRKNYRMTKTGFEVLTANISDATEERIKAEAQRKKISLLLKDLQAALDRRTVDRPSTVTGIVKTEEVLVDETSFDSLSEFHHNPFLAESIITAYSAQPTYVAPTGTNTRGTWTFSGSSHTGTAEECYKTLLELEEGKYIYFEDATSGSPIYSYGKLIGKATVDVDTQTAEYHVAGYERYIAYDGSLDEWISLYQQLLDEEQSIIDECNSRIAELAAAQETLTDIANIIKFFTATTPSLLKQLLAFWFENTYTNDNIAEKESETIKEIIPLSKTLLEGAESELQKLSQPRFTMNATVADLLKIADFNDAIRQLELGQIVTVEKEDGIWYYPALLEMSFNLDSPEEMSVVFANALKLDDWGFTYADLISTASSSAQKVSANWSKLMSYDKEKPVMDELLANPLDATLRAANANAVNQDFVIDSTGILGRKLNTDPNADYVFDPEQVRMINNVILFTDDSWKSAKTALGKIQYTDPSTQETKYAYGLIAECIVGGLVLGDTLKVYNNDGTIEIDENGISVKKLVGGTPTTVFNVSTDGTITVSGYATESELANYPTKAVTVTSVQVLYALSTSSSTAPPPTAPWSTTAPAWEDGKFMWQKTRWVYADGDDEFSSPTCLTGATGKDGTSVTILGHYDTYAELIADHPTGSLGDAYMVGADLYVWNGTQWQDVGQIKGDQGDPGQAGKGVSSIVMQYYKSTSSSSPTGGSWGTTIPPYEAGYYYFTRSFITYTDSSTAATTAVLSNYISNGSEALIVANGIAGNIYVSGTTTIDGGKIATGTITAQQIAANTITADKIDTTNLTITAYDNHFSSLDTAVAEKAQTFLTRYNDAVTTPTPPYNAGDLWVYTTNSNNDKAIFYCINSKQYPDLYSPSDWVADPVAANIYSANTTTIDGGKITTGTITADKINTSGLVAESIVVNGLTSSLVGNIYVNNATYDSTNNVWVESVACIWEAYTPSIKWYRRPSLDEQNQYAWVRDPYGSPSSTLDTQVIYTDYEVMTGDSMLTYYRDHSFYNQVDEYEVVTRYYYTANPSPAAGDAIMLWPDTSTQYDTVYGASGAVFEANAQTRIVTVGGFVVDQTSLTHSITNSGNTYDLVKLDRDSGLVVRKYDPIYQWLIGLSSWVSPNGIGTQMFSGLETYGDVGVNIEGNKITFHRGGMGSGLSYDTPFASMTIDASNPTTTSNQTPIYLDGNWFVRDSDSSQSLSLMKKKLPDPPAYDGTFTLHCIVANGSKTYYWM